MDKFVFCLRIRILFTNLIDFVYVVTVVAVVKYHHSVWHCTQAFFYLYNHCPCTLPLYTSSNLSVTSVFATSGSSNFIAR